MGMFNLMTAPTHHEDLRAPSTRVSAAWTMAAAGALFVLLMLVFILQNSQRAPLNFLWFHGNPPVGASLLLAAVIGALMVVFLGAARLLQLRLMARRHRRIGEAQATGGTGEPSAGSRQSP